MAPPQAAPASSLAEFQMQHGIDERCVNGMAELSASDQALVMDVVNNKQGYKNASAFTWSVVRRMKTDPGSVKLEFILPRLDERCSEAIKKLPRPVQESVAATVDAASCRNVSAFVWSKIRAMQQGTLQMPMSMPAVPRSRSPRGRGAPLAARSTQGLLAEMEALQAELAARQGHPGRSSSPAAWMPTKSGGAGADGLSPGVAAFAAQNGLDESAMSALATLDEEGQQLAVGLVSKQSARNPSAVTWSSVKRVRERREEVKLEFVTKSLDPGALAAFQQCPPEMQQDLVASVDVVKTRNISASIWTRIKKGEFGVAPMKQEMPQGMTQPKVEPGKPFSIYDLDDRCLEALQQLPDEVQMGILNEVPPDCRNASAFVWSKVKQQMPHSQSAPMAALAQPTPAQSAVVSALDEKCAAEFEQLPPDVQSRILSEVPGSCRNPSAFVWSRVKAAKMR